MEHIVKRVQKLLALAGNNPSEHERDRAMEAALKLLQDHKLTMLDVEAQPDDLVVTVETGKGAQTWERFPLQAAATLYYCRMLVSYRKVWQPGKGKYRTAVQCILFGSTENTAVARSVGTWLLEVIRNESNRVVRFAKHRREFRLGAGMKLCRRAETIARDEDMEPSTRANQLIAIRNCYQRDIDEYLERKGKPVGKTRSPDVEVSIAFAAGAAFGNTINLDKQLAVTPEAKQITQRDLG